MAMVKITPNGSAGVTLSIYNETEYTSAKRDVAYDLDYADGGNYGVYMATMNIGETEGAEINIYNLEPGTSYSVRAEIRVNAVLVIETAQFQFYIQNGIEIFNVEQTAVGEKSILVTWSDDYWTGAAYYIYAADMTTGEILEFYEKANGLSDVNNSVTISVDKFTEYKIRLKLILNGETEFVEKTITLDSGVYMEMPVNLRIIRTYPVQSEPVFDVIWDNANPDGYYYVWTGDMYRFHVDYSYAEDGELPIQLNNGTYVNYSSRPVLKYGQRYAIYACQYEPDNSDVMSDNAVTYAYTNPQSPTLSISAEMPGKLVISWSFNTASPNYEAISYDSISIQIIKQSGNAYNKLYNFKKDYNDNTAELTLPAGNYTVLAYTNLYDSDNNEDLQSSDTVQTITVSAARPDPFEWDTPKNKGETFKLTADEWNGFFDRINQTRVYKGIEEYVYAVAKPNADFTAAMYMAASAAIKGLGDGAGSYIPSVSARMEITADTSSLNQEKNNINVIVNELNSVIEFL